MTCSASYYFTSNFKTECPLQTQQCTTLRNVPCSAVHYALLCTMLYLLKAKIFQKKTVCLPWTVCAQQCARASSARHLTCPQCDDAGFPMEATCHHAGTYPGCSLRKILSTPETNHWFRTNITLSELKIPPWKQNQQLKRPFSNHSFHGSQKVALK